ncbi:MAG: DUF4760 domain-containing protein [Rhodospirillaceae bacterium]
MSDNRIGRPNTDRLLAVLLFFSVFLIGVLATVSIVLLLPLAPETLVAGKQNIETIYYVTNSLLFLVALGAAVFAGHQFLAAKEQNKNLKNTHRAQVFLDIQEIWDTGPMREAKILIVEYCRVRDSTDRVEINRLFSEKMTKLYMTREYFNYSPALHFIENIGLMVRRGYLTIEDINDILGTAVFQIFDLFEKHIQDLQTKFGSKTFYENAIWLNSALRAYRNKESEKTKGR